MASENRKICVILHLFKLYKEKIKHLKGKMITTDMTAWNCKKAYFRLIAALFNRNNALDQSCKKYPELKVIPENQNLRLLNATRVVFCLLFI